MQDLSNQYLIEKREPQPASSSSRSSSLGCSVLRTNYMSSVSMIYEVWLPTLITFCPQHHPRTHNFRCPPSSSLILEEPWLCSALNCWYSHSAHVSEHKCNRLEIILKVRMDVLRLRLFGVFACNGSVVLAAWDVNISFKSIHFC